MERQGYRQDECGSDDLRRLDVELIVAGDLTPAALRAMRAFRQTGVFCEVMRVVQTGETGIVYRERWYTPAEFCALVDDQYPQGAAQTAVALGSQLAQPICAQVADVLAGLPPLPPLDVTPAPQPAQPRQWLPGAPESGQQWRAPTTMPTLPAMPAVASIAAADAGVASVVAATPTPTLFQQVREAWRDVQTKWARPNDMLVMRWLMETLCACALILALVVWLLFLALQGTLR